MDVAPAASVARAPAFLPSSPSRRPSVFLPLRRLNPAARQPSRTEKQRILSLQNSDLAASTSASANATDLSTGVEDIAPAVLEVAEVKERCQKWLWRGSYSINYLAQPPIAGGDDRPPLLLVHGFGASIPHWRKNIMPLAQHHAVYAIDLLGFGLSEKPPGFKYTMETWAELILDFLDQVVQKPAVLVGNSVGSLACVIAAAQESRPLVIALVLLNCAGGMNNKAIVDDWRIKLVMPLLWLIDFLLNQRPIASSIFERVKQKDYLKNILSSVYGNKDAVDDTLVEIIKEPAEDEGALDAFVSVVTGPPGPSPIQLMPRVAMAMPVLVLWGDQDPFTPLDGPVGKYFTSLAAEEPNVTLNVLPGVGHCPHDDRPEIVHEKLLPWLAHLPSV